MSSINKAVIVGNLGQDPEVRTTESGSKVVTLSVATSESWRDKNSGEKKEKTEWHRVVIWCAKDNDGLAGIAEKYLRKGSKVYIEGKIATRKWTDKDGIDRYTTEIVLQGFGAQLVLLDRQEGGNRPPSPTSPDEYGRTTTRGGDSHGGGNAPAYEPDDDQDIPF